MSPRQRRPHLRSTTPPPSDVRVRFIPRQELPVKPKAQWPIALRICDARNIAAALDLTGGDWTRLSPGPDGTVLVH